MSQLQLSARFSIHEGKMDAFVKTARACIALIKEKEPDHLQYDWFLNEDLSECIVRETYADSDALLSHMGNVGPFLGDLLGMSDFKAEVYGTPSAELAAATAALDVTVYPAFS